MGFVEQFGGHQTQYGVPEKFEPFVALRAMLVRPGRMPEGRIEERSILELVSEGVFEKRPIGLFGLAHAIGPAIQPPPRITSPESPP